MLTKILPLIMVFMLIFTLAAAAQENTQDTPQANGQEIKPIETTPAFIMGEKNYVFTRGETQGDKPENKNPYGGYYTPGNANEPFNFRSNESKQPNSLPENNTQKEGYSGYYNQSNLPEYQFPTPSSGNIPTKGNSIELSGNNFLNDLDINSGGIPLWKQSHNAYIEVNKTKDQNINIFLLTQPKNNKIVGYNIEFSQNRGDELNSASFILQPSTSEVYLHVKSGNENNQDLKIGNFTETYSKEKVKIITFSYKDKEIKLNLTTEGTVTTSPNMQEDQPVQQTPPPVVNTQPAPVFNTEEKHNNTVLEVNF